MPGNRFMISSTQEVRADRDLRFLSGQIFYVGVRELEIKEEKSSWKVPASWKVPDSTGTRTVIQTLSSQIGFPLLALTQNLLSGSSVLQAE